MPDAPAPTPGTRLENLARLLDHAMSDPSIHLAQEFYGQARTSMETGDLSSAQRALALAEMALRFGGHATPGQPPAPLGSPASGGEGGPEPPHPPIGRPSDRR